jgi:hypothetical protein
MAFEKVTITGDTTGLVIKAETGGDRGRTGGAKIHGSPRWRMGADPPNSIQGSRPSRGGGAPLAFRSPKYFIPFWNSPLVFTGMKVIFFATLNAYHPQILGHV